jgi:hypothetical protein
MPRQPAERRLDGPAARLEAPHRRGTGIAHAGWVDRIREALRAARADLGPLGDALTILLAGNIAVLAILGTVHEFLFALEPFDLDGEQRLGRLGEGPWETFVIPAFFSAVVLLVTACLALFKATRSELLPWVLLGALFAFLAVDEVLEFHERLEGTTRIEWQMLYVPLMLVGGACWLAALRRMPSMSTERLLWLGGGGSWTAALLMEFGAHLGSTTTRKGPLPYESLIVEELLEMAGSSMMLLALFVVGRRIVAGQTG